MRFSVSERPIGSLFCAALVACLSSPPASAQAVPSDAQQIEHPAIVGGRIFRSGEKLFIVPDDLTDSGSVTLPRIYGSVRAIQWVNTNDRAAISIHPEPAEWAVRWQEVPAAAKTPAGAPMIVLEFDQEPRLPSEMEPVRASGDGSIRLEAYQASTDGEKLRYEPQPFKNTVGYWTVPTDTASWQLHIDEAGEFNVGILQGCGAGHGGSRASLSLQQASRSVATLQFEVVETGHFQNFQWRHLGRLSVSQAGVYSLKIAPLEIKHGALMDVRMIHLVRVPQG